MTPPLLMDCLLILFTIGTFWFMICNARTNSQRQAIIRCWKTAPREQFDDYLAEFEKVSYDQHLWMLVRFRNPKGLYGPLTQSIWPTK